MKNNDMITVRPLRFDDGAFLCSIFKDNREYYDIFFDSENDPVEWQKRVERFIQQNDISHHIIEINGMSVGWLSCIDAEQDSLEIGILVIKSEYLGQGFGAKGLIWLIDKAKAHGKHSILLNVNQSNARAIQFYKRFGFEICGEEIVPQCNDAENLAQYKMRLNLK